MWRRLSDMCDSYSHSIERFGETIGPVFEELENEWSDLNFLWHQYRILFDGDERKIDLLNETSPIFFFLIQKYLFESAALHVTRLFDPATTTGRANLSLLRLHEVCRGEPFADELRNMIDVAANDVRPFRDWRNRRISHNDLLLRVGEGPELQPIHFDAMDNVLSSIFEILSFVALRKADIGLCDEVNVMQKDARSMLYTLYDGVLVSRERWRRLEDGEIEEPAHPIWLHDG